MTNLWFLLLAKSTAVLAGAALVALLMSRRTAAARHLIWLSAFVILLVLPLGLLLPAKAVPKQWQFKIGAAGTPLPATAPERSLPMQTLAVMWAAGTMVLLARVAVTGTRLRGLLRASTPWVAPDSPPIRIAEDLAGPVACSFGRGAVLLPAAAREWTQAKLRAVILHEQAHVARRDCESLLAGELACALYWPNPLVWYAARRLRIEQEHAADDSVLESGWEPSDYAGQLLAIARAGRPQPLLAGAATQSMLKARVSAILDSQRRRTMLTRRMLAAALAAIAIIAIPMTAAQAGRKIYRIADGVTPPSVVYKEEPNYTEEARDAKIQGLVRLSGIIEVDGRFAEGKVEKGLDEGLDRNALEAVHRWVFKPAEKDGTPVPVAVTIEVNFRLP